MQEVIFRYRMSLTQNMYVIFILLFQLCLAIWNVLSVAAEEDATMEVIAKMENAYANSHVQ
jgi:hypothetical protein